MFEPAHPREHLWSSHRANGEGREDLLITPHSQFRRLGGDDAERQKAYRELVKALMDAERLADVRACTHKGWALGDDRFKEKIERLSQRRTAPLPRGRLKAKEE